MLKAGCGVLGSEMLRFWQPSSPDADGKAPISATPSHSYPFQFPPFLAPCDPHRMIRRPPHSATDSGSTAY